MQIVLCAAASDPHSRTASGTAIIPIGNFLMVVMERLPVGDDRATFRFHSFGSRPRATYEQARWIQSSGYLVLLREIPEAFRRAGHAERRVDGRYAGRFSRPEIAQPGRGFSGKARHL